VSNLRRMAQYITPYKLRFAFFLFTAIGYSAFSSLPIFIIKRFLEIFVEGTGATGDADAEFWTCVLLLALVEIVRVYFIIRREVAQQYLAQVAVRDATNKVIAHVIARPLAFFDRWRSGELISRISHDSQALANSIQIFTIFVREPLTIAAVLAALFTMNWRLTLVVLVGLPLAAIPVMFLNKRIRKSSRLASEVTAERADALVQVITGMRIVKGFHRESTEADAFIRKNVSIFGHLVRRMRASANMKGVVEFVTAIAIVLVFVAGYELIARGLTTPSELLTFVIGLGSFTAPIKHLAHMNAIIQESLPAAERLFKLLDTDDHLWSPASPRPASRPKRSIALRGVAFSYGRETVLSDLTIEIPVGTTTAIVGPSGSGKSTVLNLVARFHDPVSGRVEVDGVDLKEIDVEGWLGQIGLVTQDPFLFNMSIRDNIRYGRLDATDAEIEAAARLANIHDDIGKFEGGYDAMAGERGAQLSGGQRQRICLARALVRNPSILLLDEATSSLDSAAERIVQDAIERAQAGRTCVTVAHRLSTIVNADRIYVLVEGSVEAHGTHEELLASSATYRHLWRIQQGAGA
jgi:subfamily B ATP-binding cassette protein MsbA